MKPGLFLGISKEKLKKLYSNHSCLVDNYDLSLHAPECLLIKMLSDGKNILLRFTEKKFKVFHKKYNDIRAYLQTLSNPFSMAYNPNSLLNPTML